MRIFFKFPSEKPRNPGNSFCNWSLMACKAPVPHLLIRVFWEMYLPIARYSFNISSLASLAAMYRLLRMADFSSQPRYSLALILLGA